MIQTVKIIRLPQQVWNAQRPFVRLDESQMIALGRQACVVDVQSPQGDFWGRGLFSPEKGSISFLSDKPFPLEEIIKAKLQTAKKKRKTLSQVTNAWRLIHHYHDGLPGVVIEKCDQQALLRTYDSGADLLIPFLAEFLKQDFQGVFLKNNFSKRIKLSLPIQEQLLTGQILEKTWAIKEQRHHFEYDYLNKEGLFPFALRSLRDLFWQSPREPKLWLGDQYTDPMEPFTADHMSIQHNRIIKVTEQLRQTKKTYQHLFIQQPPLTVSKKNQTSWLHLIHAASQRLNRSGQLTVLVAPKNKSLIKKNHFQKLDFKSSQQKSVEPDFTCLDGSHWTIYSGLR